MPSMVEVNCLSCGEPFKARVADRKRGWGKFCSKRCKAVEQEKRTGQCRAYQERKKFRYYQKEFGGVPQFNQKGEYVGFTSSNFDNTSCQ